MQTFLPYPSFEESAKVLDRQRLGKQRIEAAQLLRGLTGTGGWTNHPASKMWTGHEGMLAVYGAIICREWVSRGYKDAQLNLFEQWLIELPDTGSPIWIGRKSFHLSHQSNLIRKLPDHYRKFFPNVPDNLPYEWP